MEELTPLGLSQSDTQVEGSGDYVAVLNANGQEVSICCRHKGAASGSWREKPDGSRVKSKLVDLAGRNLFQKFAVKEREWDLAKLCLNVFKDLSMLACHRHW